MLPAYSQRADSPTPATNSNQIPGAEGLSDGAESTHKSYFSDPDPTSVPVQTSLADRLCRSPVSDQADDYSPPNRHQLGGKGMFLQCMKEAGLPVPPFECVTTQVMNALEHQPLDRHRLARCLPWIPDQLDAEISLSKIRKCFATLPPSEQTKRNDWLAGLASFIASDDYYEQVKDSEAAREIRDLRSQLEELCPSQPIIVRSSGVNEDDYGDAQAGKYLSKLQGEEDVLRTCLEVMASAYRPEVCSEGIPQTMALIIQQCIDCRYGGVAMSYQSFQENTVRLEYTLGQPKGVVSGQSGNRPHRIDIYREDRMEEVNRSQYFPGTISSYFILKKNDNGYSETEVFDADAQSDDGRYALTDDMVSELIEYVTRLENLLFCPVDVEFAINRQGRPILLQVRPVTRLSGGMDFTMPIPEQTLAIGESVSEGYCTGPIWLAKKREAGSMPEGAIVVAHHAEDWMLEPGFLKRAGGFVFLEGGFNDHVAILMKQKRKTLMLVGGHFAAMDALVGQQATLACARFRGQPGAFVVAGDYTEKLACYSSLSSDFAEVPLAKTLPSRDDLSPPAGTFYRVTSGFQWLTDQNARLLSFFDASSELDCLANPIKLSMSPQRTERLEETVDGVKRLIYGAEALLEGYQAFLRLAGKKGSPHIMLLRDEWPLLMDRFVELKETVGSELDSIILPMQAAEEGLVSPGMFRQWVAACHQLQSSLQALNPREAEQVRSVHELIFALHQRFVEALAPVTLTSGQGKISMEKNVTYVQCSTPGETVPLISASCKTSLKRLVRHATVVTMEGALIVNMKFGEHWGLIELLEKAEGGKERTLRLKFSDTFITPDGSEDPGKLKRMWFLVQLLKAIDLDKNADSMQLSCNAVAGQIIVECPRMTSPEKMQEAFEKLITALLAVQNLDLFLEDKSIFEEVNWNFNLLLQRLDSDLVTEADRFAFQHCLFLMACSEQYDILPGCYRLLNDQQVQFIDHSRRLVNLENSYEKVLMSDDIGEATRRELLHHFLLVDPGWTIPLVEDVYPHLRGKSFIIEPSEDYQLKFVVSPDQPFREHEEKVKKAFQKNGLLYASQRLRDEYFAFRYDQ
ncbi:PEP/pyruvate-binding domain-containing protein [Endozoicomonas sp. 8E]|uniref:PEP/pyruvate-binding domain-containing protein n=1 Tax=Endozoicomonas sp. 8E TaxID=3035692 RepID=UPI002938CFB6|nr:PEP/pyruvate-binding domain-containing protein [Endozoicomonas sp. 8E]WOG25646.1 PEP/pyruvate-binding domain-containing protein [Endozoicomonas sp. 8E]